MLTNIQPFFVMYQFNIFGMNCKSKQERICDRYVDQIQLMSGSKPPNLILKGVFSASIPHFRSSWRCLICLRPLIKQSSCAVCIFYLASFHYRDYFIILPFIFSRLSLLFCFLLISMEQMFMNPSWDYGGVSQKSKGTDWVSGIRCPFFSASTDFQVPHFNTTLSLPFSSMITAVSNTLALVTNPKEHIMIL